MVAGMGLLPVAACCFLSFPFLFWGHKYQAAQNNHNHAQRRIAQLPLTPSSTRGLLLRRPEPNKENRNGAVELIFQIGDLDLKTKVCACVCLCVYACVDVYIFSWGGANRPSACFPRHRTQQTL